MSVILSALQWLGILFLVLMVFNFVILVHEWGHFLAARWRGLRVDKFQIWFGKPIWKKTINGVQYGLGSIPFGGFVALPQMAPMEAIEGKSEGTEGRDKLPPVKPLDKIIVAFAGPLFSALLGLAFACLVWLVKRPVDPSEATTTIGYVMPDMPAGKAGIRPGDQVLSIDGKPVKRFLGMIDSVVWGVVSAEGDDIEFRISRDGKEQTIMVHAPTSEAPEFKAWEEKPWHEKIFARPPMRKVGVSPAYTPKIHSLMENSPALLAGLKEGDVLRQFNGQKLWSAGAIGDFIEHNKGAEMSLVVERDGKLLPEIKLKSAAFKGTDDFDLGMSITSAEGKVLVRQGPWTLVKDSVRTTFATLGSLISRSSSVSAGHMSGPVQIMSIYHQLFNIQNGWRLVLWFSIVLNINLAILNMLPFPVLDGGHIVMSIGEMLRGRPMRGRILEMVQAACVVLLLSFMLFVTLKDVGGMFEKDKPEPAKREFSVPGEAASPPPPAAAPAQ